MSAPSSVLIRCAPSHARAFHPPSLMEPGVSSPTRNGCALEPLPDFHASGLDAFSCFPQESSAMKRKTGTARFMAADFTGGQLAVASGTPENVGGGRPGAVQ